MKQFTKTILLWFLLSVAFFVGGLVHESDIHRNLKQSGHAGFSGWLGDIKGESLRK